MSRVAGCRSGRRFFLSGFWSGSTGPESEAVISGFKDVAVVGEAIEQGGGHFGIAEHAGPLSEAENKKSPQQAAGYWW
jgi:hypothetical protein